MKAPILIIPMILVQFLGALLGAGFCLVSSDEFIRLFHLGMKLYFPLKWILSLEFPVIYKVGKIDIIVLKSILMQINICLDALN